MKEELLSRLDLLATKLGVASEHLWEVLVRQGALEGWFGVILLVLGVIVVAFCVPILIHGIKKEEPAFAIPSAIILVICVAPIAEGLKRILFLFNPEYFAVREIVKLLQ